MAFPVDPPRRDPARPLAATVPAPARPDDLPGLSEARQVEQLAGAKPPAGRHRQRTFSPSGQLTACLLFLPPALLVFTMFVTLPVFEAAYYSFFNWNGYGTPSRWVNLDNFVRLWHDPIFY